MILSLRVVGERHWRARSVLCVGVTVWWLGTVPALRAQMGVAIVGGVRTVEGGRPGAPGEGTVLGVRGHRWFTGTLGLEGDVSYAREGHISVSGRPGRDAVGSTTSVAARLLATATPPGSAVQIVFGLGPAVAVQGGDAAGRYDGSTDLGVSVAVFGRIRLSRVWALRLEAQGLLYNTTLTTVAPGVPDGPHSIKDFLFVLGLSFGR